MISRRIRSIGLSPTLGVAALAARLRAEGEDVLDFSAGQPDFPTPESVKESGKRAIDENRTRYTLNQGLLELRAAIATRLNDDQGLEYPAEQILVSPGAKASLYFAAMTLFDVGDEVLVPAPYWVTYPEQVRLARAEPVFVACAEERGFKLRSEDLEAAITPKSRALILNYPGNPTGACYTREELLPLAQLCVEHDLWVVADEIYARLLFDGRSFTSIAALSPEIFSRTIVINGMSKTYAMTGWRIGYAAGPAEVIDGMGKLQSHSTSNATSISQWASVAALELDDGLLEERAGEFQRRRDRIVARLREIPGVSCVEPEGSFYVFPNVSGLFARSGGRIGSGEELASYLLEQAKVALVPGEAFGSANHVRLSYAVSQERIDEGMDRIAAAVSAL